jgi:hypothetical protein
MKILTHCSLIHRHPWRSRLVLGVALALAGSWTPVIATDSDVRVTIMPRVLFAGQDTHVTIRVTPNEDNRLLQIVLDGPAYYASTDVQLDGANAARTHDLWWHTLPAGHYVVSVNLERASARAVMQQFSLTVSGDTNNPRP